MYVCARGEQESERERGTEGERERGIMRSGVEVSKEIVGTG